MSASPSPASGRAGTARARADAADPAALERLWPPFGLRIVSPRLVLRLIREADFPAYAEAAASGITHTARNPFASAWNEKPHDELVRSALPWLWSKRGTVGPDDWHLFLAVFLRSPDGGEGRLIGMQDVAAAGWPVLRTVTSGSWLRAAEQGNGYGSEMRAAMLLWAFDHFDAAYAESGAYEWNAASLAVSAAQGYERVGTARVVGAHGTEPETLVELRLAARDFRRPAWTVQVSGSAELAAFFASAGSHDSPGDPPAPAG